MMLAHFTASSKLRLPQRGWTRLVKLGEAGQNRVERAGRRHKGAVAYGAGAP